MCLQQALQDPTNTQLDSEKNTYIVTNLQWVQSPKVLTFCLYTSISMYLPCLETQTSDSVLLWHCSVMSSSDLKWGPFKEVSRTWKLCWTKSGKYDIYFLGKNHFSSDVSEGTLSLQKIHLFGQRFGLLWWMHCCKHSKT